MLFNSFEFIFAYLPIVFAGFFLIGRIDRRWAALWLVAASLFFYAWWNPKFVALLLLSIAGNYGASLLIHRERIASGGKTKVWLVTTIIADLALLAFYKYANFFLGTANEFGAHLPLLNIILPLGISFFTFTQLAFLVDVHRGHVEERNVVHYLLFVTWFPHLIAGPVLHHKQMMPQFADPATYRPKGEAIMVGLTMFTLGLFKKVMLADTFAIYANQIFDGAARGIHPTLFETWVGVTAYALQLYFDFSGYSDMAIGLSRMFNVRLPLNFNSPYKATSIIEFWRRWHMTLSAFLRDYLYIPLGGNRKGPVRRQLNLMATMLLGGLWHGAGWNFILWGGLHGAYLVINNMWRSITGHDAPQSRIGTICARGLTFVAVLVAWVPFRAANFTATQSILAGLFGLNGVTLPESLGRFAGSVASPEMFIGLLPHVEGGLPEIAGYLLVGLTIVWLLPSTQELCAVYNPAWDRVRAELRYPWRPRLGYALAVGVLLGVSLLGLNLGPAQFLYYQF